MRREWGWLIVTLILSASLDPSARAAGKGDDDLLQNMGDADKTAPSAYDAAAKKTTAPEKEATPEAPPADTAAPAAQPSPAPAAEAPKKVVDRIKAVPRKELLKTHRLEIAPFAGVSLNDAFYEHLTAGAAVVFYPHDAWGIGLGGEYFYVHPGTNAQQEIRQVYTSVPAVFDLPRLLAHLDLYWLPLYGKVSVFDKYILTFDGYVSAGFGLETAFGTTQHLSANFGVGKHMAINHWAAIRVDLRDHIYVDEAQVQGVARSNVQNYVLLSLGLSFFVPPSAGYNNP